ncbi:hypothetical protein [Acaryochloris sp. CCMEE 5410]|uniref:hypothetical protein n=1 Tax=Acaryochloris sp. CCMEE 5410 TaxID=310037 RepID=UPI000494AD9B|nr:hypothetical protein [Acaryochloris sp. CCMEE 5410]KAI9132882.1 hypothetical protein ON05_005690 [Acaryochloris sp. CCMEE 5410]
METRVSKRMLITKHTNQILQVDLQEWYDRFRGILIIRAFPVIGVLIILCGNIFSPRIHLSCNHATIDSLFSKHTQVVCSLTTSNILHEKITQIEHVKNAKLDYCRFCDSGGVFRVVLVANREKIPLTPDYIYRKSVVSQQVAEIKAFINNPGEATLNICEEHRWLYYLVGFATTILGVYIAFYKSLKSCTFDKSSGQLHLEYQNSLFQSAVREESLNDIHKINFKESTGDEGKDYYHTEIMFKSDEIISFRSVKDDSEIVQTINQFLGVSDSIDS